VPPAGREPLAGHLPALSGPGGRGGARVRDGVQDMATDSGAPQPGDIPEVRIRFIFWKALR